MHEFLLNVDNKEILIEILHQSIDYMTGCWKDDAVLVKSSNKYGFACPEDFLSAIKMIADAYKRYCLSSLSDTELLGLFSHMNQDLQQSILDVFKSRKPEIAAYLLREYNSRNERLLESFDWDVRFIMGDSSLSSYRTQIATIVFNCLLPTGKKSTIHFEMNKTQLGQFISALEECDKNLNESAK